MTAGSVVRVSTTRERYDAMISTVLGPHLRDQGFRKRRNTFSRSTEHGWTLIDFQASQFGTRDDVRFTINLGVNFVELQGQSKGPPSLGRTHIDERIGAVISRERQNLWWDLAPGSNFEAIGSEVIAILDEHAVPWLTSREALEAVLVGVRLDPDFIKPWRVAQLGVCAKRSGDLQLAAELSELASQRWDKAKRAGESNSGSLPE